MRILAVLWFAAVVVACGKKADEAKSPELGKTEPGKTEPAKADPPKPDPAVALDKFERAVTAIKPPDPKGAEAFQWKTDALGPKTASWRLREKAVPHEAALMLEVEDVAERVKNREMPTYGQKFGDFPADRGKDFVKVLVGNVKVQVSTFSKLKTFATDEKAAAAVMDEVLNGIDLKALSKL